MPPYFFRSDDMHFQGVTPEERYKNELLAEQKKTNELLGQIAQLLQARKDDSYVRSETIPLDGTSKSESGQRISNGNRRGRQPRK